MARAENAADIGHITDDRPEGARMSFAIAEALLFVSEAERATVLEMASA